MEFMLGKVPVDQEAQEGRSDGADMLNNLLPSSPESFRRRFWVGVPADPALYEIASRG